MHPAVTSTARLNRLLVFLEADAANLALRLDAIREASSCGDWDIARKLVDAGLRTHPQQPDLLALSGFAYLQANQYAAAEEAFSAAASQGLDAPELHYNLAFARVGLKRFAEALVLLTTPLTDAMPFALLLRSRCLHHLQRREEAIDSCRAHLVVAHEHAETHGLLALLLYEQGQGDAAMPHVAAALNQDPQQLEAMLVSASLLSDSRNFDAARATFDTLLQSHPECGRAWFGLALLELAQQRVGAAKPNIERAAAHMPDHVGSWQVLGWVNIMLGDILSAELAFNTALSANRNFGETHGGLAVIAAMQGHEAEARASIKRALRLDPQSMSARYAEMLLLQRIGQHEQAQEVLGALLARPAGQTKLQYRDLVNAQLEYLRARALPDEGQGRVVLH